MKRCPYCAEEIQDAAVVCRFCQRELLLIPSARPATRPPRRRWWPWGVAAAIVIGGFYFWGTSSASVDLEAARRAVASLEADGLLTKRSCGPNRATLPRSAWVTLPTDRHRRNMMLALSRVCLEGGHAPDVVLLDATGWPIASFDGRTVTEARRSP